MSSLRLFTVAIRSEQDVVLVRQRARDLAGALGFEQALQTSIATALSEIARNAFRYAGGGKAEFSVETDLDVRRSRDRQTLVAVVRDEGGGIANLEAILEGRYRSTTGMGLGILGTRRLMDQVDIETSAKGTTVTLRKKAQPTATPRSARELQAFVDDLIQRPAQSPLEEVQLQNRELLRAMEENRARQEEIARVNEELAETNSGVLALYDELETLHRISTTLASKLELKPLIQTIVDVTTALTNASLGAFFFRHTDTAHWSLYTISGATPDAVAQFPDSFPPDFFGDQVAAGEILHLRDLGADATDSKFARQFAEIAAVRSLLAVPVIDVDGAVLGALGFASVEPNAFSERSERILSSVAAQAAVGIEKARLFQSVTAASDAKDQFFAMLSHELRTPLNPVLAIISALHGDSRLPPDVSDDLAVVWRNIRLEARLIDDLLDFNRLIKGKMEIVRTPVNMHALTESVIAICLDELESKKQYLTARLDAPRFVVLGDSARLQQVLWNVLRNATKFTPADGQISIETAVVEDRLRITVTDSGRGIDPATLEIIFRAFEQGPAHTSARFGGLGLGLAIARMFVELHDGTISAASEGESRGACFTVELPLAAESAPVPLAPAPAPASTERERGRILLVDDHADTLAALTRLLGRRGFEVTPASSAAQARELASRQPFDLLISDLGLPDCSGHELLRDLRQSHNFPAIALSGYGMETDYEDSIQAGFQAHLTKPVDFAALVSLIQGVLTPR